MQKQDWEKYTGQGLQWREVPRSIREQARIELNIPAGALLSSLPSRFDSVNEALQYHLPSTSISNKAIDLSAYFSTQPPDDFTEAHLRRLSIPREKIVNQLNNMLRPALLDGKHSILYAHLGSTTTHFPLWVVSYWKLVHDHRRDFRQHWEAVSSWVHSQMAPRRGSRINQLAKEVSLVLDDLPWCADLKGTKTASSLAAVAWRYLGPHYTSGAMLNDLLDLLDRHVARDAALIGTVQTQDIEFTASVIDAYKDSRNYLDGRCFKSLHALGEGFARSRGRIVTIAHLGGLTDVAEQHWVAIVIDGDNRQLHYGDALGTAMPQQMHDALGWWLSQHLGGSGDVEVHDLPISRQIDGHSCGPLAYNACEHAVFASHALCRASDEAALRMELFLRVARCFLEFMSNREPEDVIDDPPFNPPPSPTINCEGFEFASTNVGHTPPTDIDDFPFTFTCDSGVAGLDTVGVGSSESPATDSGDHMRLTARVSKRARLDSEARDLPQVGPETRTDPDPPCSPSTRSCYAEEYDDCARTTSPSLSSSSSSSSSSRSSGIQELGGKLKRGVKRVVGRGVGKIDSFFQSISKEEWRAQIVRDGEKTASRREAILVEERKAEVIEKERQRLQNKDRQQRFRDKQRAKKVAAGWVPGAGRKRKRELNEFDETGNQPPVPIAEASRPKRQIVELQRQTKITNDMSARVYKPKKEKPTAVRTNWQQPILWAAIDAAASRTAKPWSPRAIWLETRKDKILEGLARQVIGQWIESGTSSWKASVLERVKKCGNAPGGKTTRVGILDAYPDTKEKIKIRLECLRDIGIPLTLVSIRALMIAQLQRDAPEVFEKRGKTHFKCSERYVRKFLKRMGWSQRATTRAAQKLPDDWEQQVEQSLLREAFVVRDFGVPAKLRVNTDQTQLVYYQGTSRTWTKAGETQVTTVGSEDKRAFTLVPAISAAGDLLPFQAIYSGMTRNSCPDPSAPCYDEAIGLGFKFLPSKTKTYWSNLETMKAYVNDILVPYFSAAKAELGLPMSQQSIWRIDCWSVHRSEAFLGWMKTTHPTISVIFVPGGCTGVFQPLDVGIQRVMKHSIRKSSHRDLIVEATTLIEGMDTTKDLPSLKVDKQVGVLRDRGVQWLVRAYHDLSKEIVQKAFQMCRAGGFDLSHASITSPAMLAKLRDVQLNDAALYSRLRPMETPVIEGDEEGDPSPDDDLGAEDSSDVPRAAVAAFVLSEGEVVPVGYRVNSSGGLETSAAVESMHASAEEPEVEQLGRGHRKRQQIRSYYESESE